MRFRDFLVGQVLKLGPVTVDADAIVAFGICLLDLSRQRE
jgi:hypothetical protein